MVSLGPLTIRIDLLLFMGTLLILYIGLKWFGLSNKQRDAILGTWFTGFLVWKASAILIGLLSTGDFRLALFATGGIWSLLIAASVVTWLVYLLSPNLRGYWVFTALTIWLAVTVAIPTYGAFLSFPSQPVHLWSAGLILFLIGLTWRWIHHPTFGAICWTAVGAFGIWLMKSYAIGTPSWWWLLLWGGLFGLALYVSKPSRKVIQWAAGIAVIFAVINAVLPQDTGSVAQQTETSTGLNIGQTPPPFELQRTDGSTVSLESLRGQRVVVNFWASWCPPCQAEMPDMANFAQDREDVTIVAINTTTSERQPDDAKAFVSPYEDDFLVVYDVDGTVGDAYRIQVMPTTYVLDETGVIIAKQFGAIDRSWLNLHLN
ncbi:TlpA family protein disulfide reductase [Exiguobacterium algae]|uniref:TlpA family protein disulfide reductase n=1 Tax=Exiguobacterium algae TaxID=2751250 RepID=UPI001BE660F5